METISLLAMLLVTGASVYGTAWLVGKGWTRLTRTQPRPSAVFPGAMPKQTHWQRATSIVELSVARASDMTACHAAASRQLEAAEYALHSLLAELGSVMATTVNSPLNAPPIAPPAAIRSRTALAA